MIAHYTQAAMALENQRLAVPAGTQSLPTSAMQEDHVSNGWAAARKLRRSVDNLRRVLAVELVCAAAGLDLRAPLQPSPATGAALAAVRGAVAGPGPIAGCRPICDAAEQLLADGSVLGGGRIGRSVPWRSDVRVTRTRDGPRPARHRPDAASAGRRKRPTGCCTTTSTPRSPSARPISSSTAAPGGRRAAGTRSTRWRAR